MIEPTVPTTPLLCTRTEVGHFFHQTQMSTYDVLRIAQLNV